MADECYSLNVHCLKDLYTISPYEYKVEIRDILLNLDDEPCIEENTKTLLFAENELEGKKEVKSINTFNRLEDEVDETDMLRMR